LVQKVKEMNIKAYLNPNPPLKGKSLIDPHGREYEMKNEPFLEVELHNFPKGEYNIQILSPFRLKKKVEVVSTCFSLYFLDHRFENPTISQIGIKVTNREMMREFNLPIRVHKLTGRVADFDGNPSSAYIWATRDRVVKHEIIVKADEEGDFTLYYPEGRRLRVFIADTTYGKTSLESWIMANELKDDLKINPHIGGKFELYEFRVWFFDGIWNLFFLPAVVDAKFPPELRKEDIRVWVDDVGGEIKSFTSHKVYFKEGEKVYYPAYIIGVMADKPSSQVCTPVIIRALVDSSETGKGEAWYIHY